MTISTLSWTRPSLLHHTRHLKLSLPTNHDHRHHHRSHSLCCLVTNKSKPTNTTKPTATNQPHQRRPLKAFPYVNISGDQLDRLDGAHKPLCLVLASSYLLTTAFALSVPPNYTNAPFPWMPAVFGALLGCIYVAVNHLALLHRWRSPDSLNVVITGASQGIGKAMAREFLLAGDRVVITSRREGTATAVAHQLLQETGVDPGSILGVACDVSDPQSVSRLSRAATAYFSNTNADTTQGCWIDAWINNAGCSGSFVALQDQEPAVTAQVVRTNIVGTLLCTRQAFQSMRVGGGDDGECDENSAAQRRGHVFNFEGAGSNGMATFNYAAYGTTKAMISQLTLGALRQEASALGIGLHTVQPGMVLTELLLSGASIENKRAFNVLCEQPETVAAFLVARIRSVIAREEEFAKIEYLTPWRALMRLLKAPFNIKGRFFDFQSGAPLYIGDERERLKEKRTRRLAKQAACQSYGLGLAYSASIAVAYLIFAYDAAIAAAPAGSSLIHPFL